MRTLWNKENPQHSLYCYEIETNNFYVYVLAQNEEQAKICYINEGDTNEELFKIQKVVDNTELYDKRFFIGESGTESCKNEWASLHDFMTWHIAEFRSKHFYWEQPHTPSLLHVTWDKTNINFQIYKEEIKNNVSF